MTLKVNESKYFLQAISTKKLKRTIFINELYSATPVIVSDRRDENGKTIILVFRLQWKY